MVDSLYLPQMTTKYRQTMLVPKDLQNPDRKQLEQKKPSPKVSNGYKGNVNKHNREPENGQEGMELSPPEFYDSEHLHIAA
ncbi:hypothetical protein CHS0354_033865 [Potamilus streckersoni]|uniref:Uncharacterized protein n=1 Tax=Potamilus streckersoni TaxID=2493646 RepID=A0AAE0RWQ3_9BIVA|nr:hypothetical protein CHS0354_033865 [Potamilus streckersoni]